MSRDSKIVKILEKDPASVSVSQQVKDLRYLDVLTSSHKASPLVYDIRLYVNDGFIYSNRRVTTYNLKDITEDKWVEMFPQYYDVLYFAQPYEFTYILNNTQRIVSLVVPIRSSIDFKEITGIISVDMLESHLIELMKIADYSSKGEVIITDINNVPLLSYSQSATSLFKTYKDINDKASKAPISFIDNYVVGKASLLNAWNLITIASMEDLLASQSNIKLQFTILAIILGILVYFLSYLYGRHNAKRINSLAKQIQIVESGVFDVNCIVDSADEIGDLQTSFNYMTRKINSLMEEQYQLGKNLNVLELNMLQAQINPHFLYNTLDLISWTAKRNDVEAVCDIVLKLSKFYRISLNNGENFIAIWNELEHVDLYVQLQNHRFAQKIQLTIKIDDDLKDYKIMKMLLQPIIENSIIHGISNSDRDQGEINISASIEDEMIKIIIKDNGVGMSQKTINQLMIFTEIHDDSNYLGGYGLKNVINRLKLYYDNKARILFESKQNVGTWVTITIPYAYLPENKLH